MIKAAKVSSEPNAVSPWFTEPKTRVYVCVCVGVCRQCLLMWVAGLFVRDNESKEGESEHKVCICELLLLSAPFKD